MQITGTRIHALGAPKDPNECRMNLNRARWEKFPVARAHRSVIRIGFTMLASLIEARYIKWNLSQSTINTDDCLAQHEELASTT